MKTIKHNCFVIMPFGDERHNKKVYDAGIKKVLDYLQFNAIRMDRNLTSGLVIDEIKKQIKSSYFVIADLSLERPNCYYESGLAHALKKPVLFIRNEEAEVHFDLKAFQCHTITDKNFGNQLENLISDFLITPDRSSDDDHNGKFGRKSIKDGFKLTAEITSGKKGNYLMNVQLIELSNSRKAKQAKFHLHRSYDKSEQNVKFRNGVAVLEDWTLDGPFTIGTTVDNKIELELDLSTLPGGDGYFYKQTLI